MKTKLIAFALAAFLSASAGYAATKKITVGKYIVFYEDGATKALVCTLAPMRGA